MPKRLLLLLIVIQGVSVAFKIDGNIVNPVWEGNLVPIPGADQFQKNGANNHVITVNEVGSKSNKN